ncbi:4'-phosphopantetheinyl transferase family protein [Paenibacillus donghaensis]|uniref:Uncharacterized protein n=1 Tax=Paenibacillus donghaensis TaxID=414771 RepID=A0A2Z2KQI8_9BACL|nr:4'-phosphopantetheinyl transferase superfamily protein [Paenibacillus donghaensis]ASA21138.1 hypothetical protein B9T62_10275 [Paenibacillus donghaensis]
MGVKMWNGEDTGVCCVEIPADVAEPTVLQLMSALSAAKQQKIRRLMRREDALNVLMADILSRLCICRTLGIRNREIEFGQNAYGKPHLMGQNRLHFNRSHSGSWAAVAVSTESVGIDVERISKADLGVAERFFAPQEYRQLLQVEGGERQRFFYDLWTLKESYIKAAGQGLSLPLSSFSIDLRSEQITLETEHEWKPCYFRQYPIDPAYRLSLCSPLNRLPDDVEMIGLADLCEEFSQYL